jgi:hypothetical protein
MLVPKINGLQYKATIMYNNFIFALILVYYTRVQVVFLVLKRAFHFCTFLHAQRWGSL